MSEPTPAITAREAVEALLDDARFYRTYGFQDAARTCAESAAAHSEDEAEKARILSDFPNPPGPGWL